MQGGTHLVLFSYWTNEPVWANQIMCRDFSGYPIWFLDYNEICLVNPDKAGLYEGSFFWRD